MIFLNDAMAQSSSLGIKMVPVTLPVPELQLNAPLGSTNALEISTNLTTWQEVATFVFTTTNLTWRDLSLRHGAYYRLRRVTTGGSNPPFPAPLPNLVWIPPGQFLMGSPETDPDALSAELEQTLVTLTQGFFMSKYEVTQAEYLAVTGSNPSQFGGDPDLPVDSVSWQNATNFCRLLNQQESTAGRLPAGYAYRLPTEAEWEYAARAGNTTRFHWGNTFAPLDDYAWYSGNAGESTHPVGQKLPNQWGLYDMAGNVCEWTINSFDTLDSYPGGEAVDPISTAGNNRVFRGGSHADEAASCRHADRKNISDSLALNIFGFRIVLAPL